MQSMEDSIAFGLRANPIYMLLYQNIATIITQFLMPLIVLCYLNLHVSHSYIHFKSLKIITSIAYCIYFEKIDS